MNRRIFLVMPFVFLSLVIGTYNGLIRIGWDLPINKSLAQHGAIMVGSFLGSLILLERVVIFRKGWLYVFPVASGLSILLFLTGKFLPGMDLLIMGDVALACIYIYLYYKHRELFLLIMLTGAICLLGGYLMLIHSRLYPASVPFWFAFILFTIIGERLELTKFLPESRLKFYILFFSVLLFFAGLFLSYHGSGHLFAGLSMIILSLWLTRFDIAFKSVKIKGIHRYIALNLIAGYIWLLISGTLLIISADMKYMYDATLHSFFLGFTFSMIIAHGPIIIPAIAGVARKPFHPVLYLWGMIMQISLIIRILADLAGSVQFRELAGMFNVIAVIGFFINVLVLMKVLKSDPVS
jgi:hypothetical protein